MRTEEQRQQQREQQRRYQEKYFKGVRLDGKAARVETRPSTPKSVSGRVNKGGLGAEAMQRIREAAGTIVCGNCREEPKNVVGGELDYNAGCDQYLCPKCQQKYRRAIFGLSVSVKLNRQLGLTGMVVSGTHFPAADVQ